MAGVFLVLMALLATPANAATSHVSAIQLWRPGGVQTTPSVPGRGVARPGLTPSQTKAMAVAAKPAQPARVTWPAGTGTATLTPARHLNSAELTPGAAAAAGALPVTVASADPAGSAARSVSVTVSPRAAATEAGVDGVLLSVARADGGSTTSTVSVGLDSTGFAAAYGGGWGDRLRLVALPACALRTPQLARCRTQTPVAFTRNAGTLTAQVTVGGAPTVLAADATASGSVGTYTATSLSPEGQWSAGGDSGSFTYSYPILAPTPPTGTAPSVALAYNSGSVDGRTSATNAQASWIGDGWDYSPGYVERSYQSCSSDGIANSSDLCWAGNLVSLSLAGKTSLLVRDDTSGTWKLQNDNGTQVIPLQGQSNGAWQGEAWEIVTPDGTRSYFGVNHLPTGNGSDGATNSAWTEPVYCPKSGDGPPGVTCHSSSAGTNSFVTNMAYRWNLDYVVDPHGNLQTYDWTPESNYYQRGYAQGNGVGTNTSYIRGGYLSAISYGYRLSDAIAGAKPVDVVNFGVAERCLTSATFTNCAAGNLTSGTASNWPDVPFDQVCATQGGTCSNYAPSFFTTKRLTSINTTVLVNGSYDPVDSYQLDQMFPAPQAGVVSVSSGESANNQGDGTVAVMWLNSIRRTGNDTLGGGSPVTLPPTTFTAMETPNRVDGATTGAAALYRPRMDYLTTESGDQIVVSYAAPDCSRVNGKLPASADSDTLNCYSQYWTPTDGTGPVQDWFNKPQVTMVTVNDLVAPAAWSEAQVTSYAYQGIAWHRDDSPLTPSAQRTWNQFRGYRTVTTTVGLASAQSVPTQTVTTYLQGMDGDHLANGSTRSVTVTDSVGDHVTDSDWLSGQTLESQTLAGAGGAVASKTVNGPWTYRSTSTEAQSGGMPSLVARMTSTADARQYTLWHDGSWRTAESDTTYDTSARVVTVDSKGDGTSALPEVCTTTSYAQDTGRNMLSFPDEVKAVQGACGTAATAANTVSDSRTFYDSSSTLGSLTGPGDATRTDAVDGYNSAGTPSYMTQGASAFDAYGRVTSATNADGHTTTTTYSAPGVTPDTTTVRNPMGWTTTATVDPARALPISATDVNGELTTETYDGLGRLTGSWSPLHSQAAGAPADATFAYSIGGASAPTTVSTSTLRDDGSYGTEVQVYDGSLRLMQQQTPTADGSAGRLVADSHYNSLGQTVKTTSPYYDSTSGPSSTVFIAADDSVVPLETESFHDGLGRITQSLTVAKGVNQWSTYTGYRGMDETDTTPPAGGPATSTFVDAAGRKIASWTYNTATPTGNAADAVVTTYGYTPAGKLATTTDAAGNQWHYTYDLHQRQVQAVDPGSGASKTTYSPGGEVLTTTDGRNRQLTNAYDALGRRTAEYDTTGGATPGAANELAAWTYDTLANGQTTSSTRYTNGATDAAHTYTESVAGYTATYQPTGVSVTIPSGEGALAGTYQSSSAFSAMTSLPIGTHYNAEGGLPREQDNYSYTPSGLLSGFGGTYTYLNDVSYSPLGQVLQTNFGPYGSQFARTQTYDQPTGRLLTVADGTQTSTASAVDSTSYTYNPAGSITALSTVYNGASTDTQCFTYDQQNRLTAAWTDTGGVNSPVTGQILGVGGCADSAPVAGKVTGGPAPYWESFGYDALGDRVTETSHDTSVSSTANDVTQTLSYNGYNANTGASTATGQPDAVRNVATTNAGNTTNTGYTYDTAGNVVQRANQKLGYDAEGRTSTVTNTTTNTVTSYTYDAGGKLLLQRDPATADTVLYLPYGEEIHLDTKTGAVSGLRYYSKSPDGVLVVRSSTGTVDYELSDKLKTATTVVDATTLAVTRRFYDPYGNARGTAPASWPDQRGYLGKPTDPTTGLDLLGARDYDPVTGRFLSVDPVLENGDARQMNGYSYAADNPVNGSDPTGLMQESEGGGCSDYDYMPGGACFLGGGNSAPPPPPPPTITIQAPDGTKKTVNANDTDPYFYGHKPGDLQYAWIKSQGYTGDQNFTYAEVLAWAKKSPKGWLALCEEMPLNPAECGHDPFNGEDLHMDGWSDFKKLGSMATVAGYGICLLASDGACALATLGEVGIGSAIGVHEHKSTAAIIGTGLVSIYFTGVSKAAELGSSGELEEWVDAKITNRAAHAGDKAEEKTGLEGSDIPVTIRVTGAGTDLAHAGTELYEYMTGGEEDPEMPKVWTTGLGG
jgi:RHS repeat-associated protein